MKSLFLLQNDITFLNFGSFGACPKPVFDAFIRWQYLLESEPIQFFTTHSSEYINTSRKALAEYLQGDPENFVFVPNPTWAINIIAKNLRLQPDDEVLSTNLEYGAMDKTWNYYCKKLGAKYIQQKISLPIASKEAFLNDFWKGYSTKTKMVFISQITSSTGLILPVKEICEEAKRRGLITVVDGAHVPGHIDLDLSELKADFYTGACHKWMMTPKGSSFLYVRKEFQNELDPLIISWGFESANPSGSRFYDYHQFNGTRDFSAYLTIPDALEFMHQNNWNEVSKQCKKLVLQTAPLFYDVLGTEPLAPLTTEFYGQMCSAEVKTPNPEQLQRHLFEQYKIEIPVMRHREKNFIRYSVQGFNTKEEIAYLLESLKSIKATTDLIR